MCYSLRTVDHTREHVAKHPDNDKESALWHGFSSVMQVRIKPRSRTGAQGEEYEDLQCTREADYALPPAHRVRCCSCRHCHTPATAAGPRRPSHTTPRPRQ